MKSGYIYVYDNGIINITAYTCPAGFNPGRINTLKKSKKNRRNYALWQHKAILY